MISSNMGTAQLRDSTVYTDLNGLNSIRQLGKDDSPEALRQIAIQFESIFLNMMLKEMRKGEETLFTDNYLRTNEMAFHRDNLDNQLGLHLASQGGIGLADALYHQMLRHHPSSDTQQSPDAHQSSDAFQSSDNHKSSDTKVLPTPGNGNATRQDAVAAYREAGRQFAAPMAEPAHDTAARAGEAL